MTEPPPSPSVAALVAAGCSAERAADLLAALAAPADSGEDRWDRLSRSVLRPADPFAAHEALFAACHANRPASAPPAPAWRPTAAELAATHAGPAGFAALHHQSVAAPAAFWTRVLSELGIVFAAPPSATVDVSSGAEDARWLPGAEFNIALSCFDGRDPGGLAVVRQTEGGPLQTVSRAQLRSDAEAVARSLAALGLGPGDAVAIDMPMTLQSVVVYLGVVLLGGAVVSIADSFAAEEIGTRLRISGARAIVTQDVIVRGERRLPLYERVVAAEAPLAIVIPAEGELAVPLRAGDRSWAEFIAQEAPFTPHLAGPEHVTNILFSSGTTGEPKAIPWTQVTPIKAATDGWAHHDIHPGEVVAWPTNLGWMMGPWLIYAALLNGAAIALYEGPPHGEGFCRFVQDAGVTMLGVVPSLVRAWQTNGATDGVDWSGLRCFSSTGEASNPREYLWLMSRAGYRPVVEYCGGTEIGGGYICGSLAQPQSPSTFSTPAIGCALHLLGDDGRPAVEGEVALVPPMLGSSNRLLNRDHHAVYFEGMPAGPEGEVLRRHGDWMEALPGGYFRAHGRADDTMNLGGIKTSSAELERACNRVPGVVESAAVAVPPPGGGPSQLHVFVVGPDADDGLRSALQAAIRGHLNPLFKLAAVHGVDALPRTASGKVMRRVLRARLTAN